MKGQLIFYLCGRDTAGNLWYLPNYFAKYAYGNHTVFGSYYTWRE